MKISHGQGVFSTLNPECQLPFPRCLSLNITPLLYYGISVSLRFNEEFAPDH